MNLLSAHWGCSGIRLVKQENLLLLLSLDIVSIAITQVCIIQSCVELSNKIYTLYAE